MKQDGGSVTTSENVNLVGLNNSDRAYFRHHRDSPERTTLVSNPVKSRSGGQWIIPVSRRVNHADGSFAGVVVATVEDYKLFAADSTSSSTSRPKRPAIPP